MNERKEKRVKITQNIFNCVKRLIQSGAPAKEIAEYMGISAVTVYRIRDAETLEEYQHITMERSRAVHAKQKENKAPAEQEPQETEPQTQVVEHRQSVTIVANHYMAEQLQKQTELLTLISNKMAYIMEMMEQMKEMWK